MRQCPIVYSCDITPCSSSPPLPLFSQDGSVVHFKIKKNTPLRKLMQAYCDKQVYRVETGAPTVEHTEVHDALDRV